MARIELGIVSPAVVTVATAGTRVPLSATSLLVRNFVVLWNDGNTGAVYIGDSTVDATHCIKLNGSCPSYGFTAEDSVADEDNVFIDLNKVYIDAANNGDFVYLSYTELIDKAYNS